MVWASGHADARTISIVPQGQEIGGSVFEAGGNGHAVVGWSPVQEAGPMPFRAAASSAEQAAVRLRLPGTRNFGPVRKLGRPGSTGLNVGVTRDGRTLASWSEADGSIRASIAGRKGRWKAPVTVFGKGSGSGGLAVGPDGTAAIYVIKSNRDVRSVERYIKSKKVFVSTRSPRGRFSKPRLASRGGGVIGNYADLEAGTRGRVTLTWSGWCPLGDSSLWEPARIVDIRGGKITRPRAVPNSHCPTFGIDLGGRPGKAQFLLIDGSMKNWNGVRVARRPAGKPFRKARLISEPGVPSLGADLAVSARGRATVIWGYGESANWNRLGYRMIRLKPDGAASKPRAIPAVKPDDFLLAVGGAPGGRISLIWQHIPPPGSGPDELLSWMAAGNLARDGNFSGRTRFTPLLPAGALHLAKVAFSTEGRRYILWAERGGHGHSTGLNLTGP